MSVPPRHVPLETQFAAAVPPQRASWPQRLLWWLALRLMALPPVQRFIEKKYQA